MDTIEQLCQRRKENKAKINELKAQLRALADDSDQAKIKALRREINDLYYTNKCLKSEIAYENCIEREFISVSAE